MKNLILIFVFLIQVGIYAKNLPKVTIPLGTLEGYLKETVSGKPLNAFEGIPYAQPPVGRLRFKEPEPPKPWIGIWQAKTIFKCVQYNQFTRPGKEKVEGDEDCLYLNIYSPVDANPSKKLDVLVYFHGGAFMFNYGGSCGPEIILNRDIIYINLNYRLGPLGFLSTEDDVVPGNMGLKDQQMALKWIKENVEYFGGNPESVTIFGLSAGGASVQLHYLMPKSNGLFKGGISQSGTSLNPWVIMEHPLEKTKKVASFVGCPTSNSSQIIECLENRPAKQITNSVKQFQPWLYNPFSPFGIVVDTWATNPALPDHPYNLLKDRKVLDLPWLTSYVSSEGLYPGTDFYREEYLEHIDKHWNEVLPYILHYNDVVEPRLVDEVSQKIRREYLGDAKLNRETFKLFVQIISDRLFIADIEKASKLHSAATKSPVYSYHFDYRGAHSISELISVTKENIGVTHSDDTAYILKNKLDTLSTKSDSEISTIMVDIVVSFMQTGTPNITSDWRPLSKKITDPWVQLAIRAPDNIKLEEINELGNRAFWDSLPFNENDKIFHVKDVL